MDYLLDRPGRRRGDVARGPGARAFCLRRLHRGNWRVRIPFADRHRRSEFTSHFSQVWHHSPPALCIAAVFALVLGGIQYSDGATTLLGVLFGLGLTLKWSESNLLPKLPEVLSTIVHTCLIALIGAAALVLYTAESWDLLSNISLPSFLYAIGFIGLFVLGIVGMAEISWTLVRSVLNLRPDPEFADRPLRFFLQFRTIKRASTASIAACGAIYLAHGIGDAMVKGERIGQCDLSGIEEVVFITTGWQQDTKAASICSWPRKEPLG
jgi:hypothetical protein